MGSVDAYYESLALFHMATNIYICTKSNFIPSTIEVQRLVFVHGNSSPIGIADDTDGESDFTRRLMLFF